jgi:hypothetical protein
LRLLLKVAPNYLITLFLGLNPPPPNPTSSLFL